MAACGAQEEPDWGSLNLIGRSGIFRETLAVLQQCAGVDATVLLCGETGTGKELAARAIHYLSERRRGLLSAGRQTNLGAISRAG
jgi:transcriptional regulator with GAF, ATPase, and Fis domain